MSRALQRTVGPTRRTALTALAALGGATALGGGLSACGGSSGDSAGAITHWDWLVSQDAWAKSEIALFQKANAGLTVNRTVNQTDKYPDLVSLSQRSHSLPDVMMIPNSPDFSVQVANGWVHPLDDLADDAWIRSFPKYSFVEGVNVFDGKLYSAPFSGNGPALQLYVNNAVFKAAGLVDGSGAVQVPTTWDEVTSAAKAITRSSGGKVRGLGAGNSEGITLYHWLAVFLYGAGVPGPLANGLDLRRGAYTVASDPHWADFLDLLKSWFDDGLFWPNTLSASDEVARAQFAAGAFGMIVGGSWNIGPWKDAGFEDYSVTALVSPTATPQGYFQSTPGGTQLALSADVRHPEDAWKWFAWWNSADAGRRWVQDYHLGLSVFPENNDPAKIDLAPFAAYVALADQAKLAPVPAVRNPDAAKVALPSVTPSISDVLTGHLTGQVGDLPGALRTLQDASEKALDGAVADAVSAGAKVSREDFAFPDWDLTKDYTYSVPEYPSL